MTQSHPLSSLIKAFAFDEADLEVNRTGRLSESQRARLRRSTLWTVGAMVLWPMITWAAVMI